MSWFVYIVECIDKTYYTGITYNLKNRIADHNCGRYKKSFTKGRLPVKLVYWERFDSRISAAKREIVIKDKSRINKEKLIKSLHRISNL